MLWLTVIGLGTWAGGTLYQMLVIVPIWSGSPPDSVRSFFGSTDYNRTIWRFFGPPFMLARGLPLLAALLAGWPFRIHRRALLVATVGMVFNVILTIAYIYPINAVLFEQAGGGRAAGEVQAMVDRWILADRFRFAVGTVSFLAVLVAFRLPPPRAAIK